MMQLNETTIALTGARVSVRSVNAIVVSLVAT